MKRITCLVVVVFLLCLGSCGVDSKPKTRKRTRVGSKALSAGGKVVDDDDAAWQVAIMKKRRLICAGSLLRNNVVLTAAECIKDVEPADLLIRGGSKSFKKGGQLRKVRETVHHPEYDEETHGYNVALLHLMRPFNASDDANIVRPVKLPDETVAELPVSVTVYGWGGKTNNTMTKKLRLSKTKVYSAKKCKPFLADEELIDSVFCTGDRVKQVDLCNDDLGSPAMGESNVQFGVVSESSGCSRESHTTVFTNVMPLTPWIRDTMDEFRAKKKNQKEQSN